MAAITPESVWTDIENIRNTAPLTHNITNYVVMNSTANALLAIGASPVMAHAEPEVAQMAGIASALVINIGTLSDKWIAAMKTAMKTAAERGIPIVLDPVGVGATSFRTETAKALVETAAPTIIRGNASEIMALVDAAVETKGVDATASSDDAVETGKTLRDALGCVVCVTGATDYVIGDGNPVRISNGHAMMTRVTGLGCTATALCGAFAAVNEDPKVATAHAMAAMGIAGEMAAEKSTGPGSLQLNLYDSLYAITAEDVASRLRVE